MGLQNSTFVATNDIIASYDTNQLPRYQKNNSSQKGQRIQYNKKNPND